MKRNQIEVNDEESRMRKTWTLSKVKEMREDQKRKEKVKRNPTELNVSETGGARETLKLSWQNSWCKWRAKRRGGRRWGKGQADTRKGTGEREREWGTLTQWRVADEGPEEVLMRTCRVAEGKRPYTQRVKGKLPSQSPSLRCLGALSFYSTWEIIGRGRRGGVK